MARIAARRRVRISVLKRLSPSAVGFEMDGNVVKKIPLTIVEGNVGACERLRVGQEFVVSEDLKMPEGFCPSAWVPLYTNVRLLSWGGDLPFFKEKGVAINCCIDGLRPVIFKLERI